MSSLVLRLLRRLRKTPRGNPKIKRGTPFTKLKNINEMFFETEFFKYNAAPQYLIRYWLENRSPKWSCTCPDFVFRQAPQHKMCKHCHGAAMLTRPRPTAFVIRHVKQLTEDMYNKMLAMPIGEPLPILPRGLPTKRMRITIGNSEPGYIAYIGSTSTFVCYTCGGAAGSHHLKGRQCKHIACYSKSLVDDDYVAYCQLMSSGTFRTAVNRQKNENKTAWQRFV
jgi:predicted nucleic acid-binding Zn finger protein